MDWSQVEEVSKGVGNPCFHCSEPDGRRSKHGRNSIRLGQAKDRTIQKYLVTSSTYSVLVKFKARSEEMIAVLTNTITRNRSLQHTACDFYWESGVHEDWGGAIPSSTSVSKVPSRCTEAEFAKWTTGSTWSRRKKILRPHESQRKRQKVDSAVRESCEQGVFPAGTWMRPKRLIRSATSRRSWSPTGATPRSSSFAKPLPRHIGKLALCSVHVGDVSNLRKVPKSWPRRTSTPWQYQVTSSKRTFPVVPNMELPSGNEFTTKPRRCCRKLANPSMVVTKQFGKDGTMTTNTASLCQIFGGLREQIIQYDELALEDHSFFATRKEKNSKRE